MTHARLKLLAAPLAVLAVAGCPDTFNTQFCPSGTRNEGQFTATFTLDSANPDDCRVVRTADGGPADASLAVAPQPFVAAICSQPNADGGAPLVLLSNGNGFPRISPLGDGGTFEFTSSATVQGTACVCTIDVAETISGTLLPASGGDAGAAWDPDAGAMEPLRGFTSTVTDRIDGGAGCRCNVPCSIRYSLVGTK